MLNFALDQSASIILKSYLSKPPQLEGQYNDASLTLGVDKSVEFSSPYCFKSYKLSNKYYTDSKFKFIKFPWYCTPVPLPSKYQLPWFKFLILASYKLLQANTLSALVFGLTNFKSITGPMYFRLLDPLNA